MIRWTALLLLFTLCWPQAQAKVFNFNSESLAAYLKGDLYPAKFENTLYSQSHGASSSMDTDIPYNLAGEFGFIYARPRVQLRFGLEVIHPLDRKDQPGNDGSGNQLYSMTSELSVLIPKVGIDFTVKSWPQSRLFVGGTAGWATLVARNSYTFTAAGTSQYGIGDFYEDLRGQTPQYEGLVGYERLLSDSTTIAVEGSYRALVFDEISHNRDTTTFQGAVSKGDKARNTDGSQRSLDLTQYFIGLGLRFWIH